MRVHAVARAADGVVSSGATPARLTGVRVVHHDSVEAKPLAFADGRVADGANDASDAFELDLSNHFVYPGFINAHDHLQLNAIPPLVSSRTYANSYEWIDAMEQHRQRDDVAAAASVPRAVRHWHGALKNVLAGVTTVAHHDPRVPGIDEPSFPVAVPRDLGWSHSLGMGGADGNAPRYGPPVVQSVSETPSDRPWIVHLAEGVDVVAAGELGRLDELGCLASNTVIVHGVGLTSADVTRVIDAGASVVWCPSSNVRMFGRTLDVAALARAHRVALGTDSRLTGARDLLDELRVAAEHSALAACDLMRLVTSDAAAILREPDIGGLRAGQRADCVVARADGDPYGALLSLSRADIRAVVRDGAPVVADPDLAEWFARCNIPTMRVCLDGRPKLVARATARADAMSLEPGLEPS